MNYTQTVITAIQTIILVAGFIYTTRALRHTNDSRNIDFIIEAEGQIDPLFIALMNEPPDTVRAVLPDLIPSDASDLEVKGYVYTYFAYRHLSRIIYMLSNPSISIGMTGDQREEFVEDWLNELKKYNQDIVVTIHSYCRRTGEFNDTFVASMDRLYGFSA